MIAFSESEERVALRAAVRELANKYGRDYFAAKARAGEKTTEMWAEAGKLVSRRGRAGGVRRRGRRHRGSGRGV
jgi:hypothetical protein